MEDEMITLTKAAKIAGVTPEALRSAARKGTLKAKRLGPRAWMVTRNELKSWMENDTFHIGGRPKVTKP